MSDTRIAPAVRVQFGLGAVLFVLAALILAGCSKPGTEAPRAPAANTAAAPDPWFKESAQAAGLTFVHSSGATGRFYNPEIVCGGVGLLDYDNDGYLDVFCVQGGSLDPATPRHPQHKLYRNLRNGHFEEVTERAGLVSRGYGYGMGCTCADFDQDGRVDIYVTQVGTNLLYHNNGNGTFTEVGAQAGVDHAGWSSSAAFLDYDGDGRPDLFVANYLKWNPNREVECFSRGGIRDYCSPLNYNAPAMDRLYHNEGNGRFSDVTLAAGLDRAYGNGLGVACADFNGDGRVDIFVANDATPNQLWMNQGQGRFRDEALLRGCAVNALGIPEAGMGVLAHDLLNRGWTDLFVTHLVGEGNRFFANTNGYFSDWVAPKGPGATSLPYTGFGVVAADFDNDGELDIYIGNGRVKYGPHPLTLADPYAEPNTLLRGLGQGNFEAVNPEGGVRPALVAASRGVAAGDLANDGGIDVVVINKDGPVHLLKNLVSRRGHWIGFKVLNRTGTDAVEASVAIESGPLRQVRPVRPNQSYCSSNDPRVHFGLGTAAQVDSVIVTWPDKSRERFGPYASGAIYELRQGSGR